MSIAFTRRFIPSVICVLSLGGCGKSPDPRQTPDGGGPTLADGSPATPDAAPDIVESCPETFIGSGDGCDCGCGIADPDCPTPGSIADCEHDNCGDEADIDPSDPTQCIAAVVPAGWTCSAYFYGNDGVCTCGCGALDDKDCPVALEIDDCYGFEHGCASGKWPDPADPTRCVQAAAGWTCNFKSYHDGTCWCGCGVADPGCPANPHISQCVADGCESGDSPDPGNVTQCIDNAPQDDWTCNLALLDDGSQCDCGCGAVDPDCGANPSPASCDVVHCGTKEELKPGTTAECWEICTPSPVTVGNATCTNGGFVSIFNSCERNLSACSDGRTYEVECVGGECVCRVNGQCVGHATGGCSLNFTCGWHLIDAT